MISPLSFNSSNIVQICYLPFLFVSFPLVTFLCVNCYSSHSIDSSRLVKFWLNAIWIMNTLQVHAKLKCGPLGCASQTYMKHQVCSEGTLFRIYNAPWQKQNLLTPQCRYNVSCAASTTWIMIRVFLGLLWWLNLCGALLFGNSSHWLGSPILNFHHSKEGFFLSFYLSTKKMLFSKEGGPTHCRPQRTSAPWRMDGKWSRNSFPLASSCLANHDGYLRAFF
jgi:hypothetical protein